MVREQEPPKAPLAPAKQNRIPHNPPHGEGKITSKPASSSSHKPQLGLPSPLRPTPMPPSFSTRPPQTSWSGSPSSLSSDQSLYRPAVNPSFHPPPPPPSSQVFAIPHELAQQHPRPEDKYSNLFIASKKPSKPPANPLLQARNTMYGQQQQQQQISSSTGHDDDQVVEIPRPTKLPAFAPRPAQPPIFSSQPMPPKPISNFIDLTANTVGMATNNDLFHDRFGAADPHMYINPGKAAEEIKALLEGALDDEDEDGKPRTRRRKRQVHDDLVAKLGGMKVKGDENQEAEAAEEDESDEDDGTVEGLKVKLLPHQIEGVDWMRDKELGTKKTRGVFPKGGILADDMGLGKTIQSIALMLTNPKPAADEADDADTTRVKRKLPAKVDKGTLVVAPLALIKQWEGEIRERVEDSHAFKVCVHHGPQRAKSFKKLKEYDIVITTYHTLVSEHGSSSENIKVGCFGMHWYRVILDEAHSIKNGNAKATKAACALNAEYRWCLTGTPMQNNLDELQSLIHFLRIKPYENLNEWRDQITKPMNNGRGGLAIKRLQVYLKAFMKRRTKDILKQEGALRTGGPSKPGEEKQGGFKIVKRTIEKVEAEFSPEERAFYMKLETRADKSLERMMAGNQMSYASALVLLLRLRQACNHVDLVKGELALERDGFSDGTGLGSQSSSQRKKAVKDDDLDSIATMLGGLSVATKRCDICQLELSAKESSSGAIRCAECEADLKGDEMRRQAAKKAKMKKSKKSPGGDGKRARRRQRKPRRNVIADSDEEEEGDGVAAENEGRPTKLGSAGDLEDEKDEGDGESAASDSDVEHMHTRRRQKATDPVNDEEEEDSDSATGDEETSSADEDDACSDEEEDEVLSLPFTSTKIRHLLRILHADSASHKYIIFSFFTSMLDLIEPFLRRDGLIFTRYDGQMRNDLREASLERLRNHDPTRILLCSLRAGSLGLNLTAASRVVVLEPFWNPFVEEQAIDRVHRLNQSQDVIVFKMTVKDTVEARILDLQDRKRQLADATIEGKTKAAKLTMEDMLKLFRHDAEHTHQVDGIGLDLAGRDRVLAESGQRKGGRKEHEVYGRRW